MYRPLLLALFAAASDAQHTLPPLGFLSPAPQHKVAHSSAGAAQCEVDGRWYIAADLSNATQAFAAGELQRAIWNATAFRLPLVALDAITDDRFIALGTLPEPAISSLAKARKIRGAAEGALERSDGGGALSAEGYVLDICGGGGGGVLLAGVDAAGVFYGVQTLIQLVSNLAAQPARLARPPPEHMGPPPPPPSTTPCRLPPMRVTDWPHFRLRGMHVHELDPGGMADPATNFYALADEMAAHKMNFFSAMTVASVPIDLPKYGQFQLEMQAYARRRHMEYVPSIGLGQAQPQDARTAEGIWARDVEFTADGGRGGAELLEPSLPAIMPLPNGDFEGGIGGDGDPRGWEFFASRDGTSTWGIDSDHAHLGRHSMRCDVTAPTNLSARLLSHGVAAVPNRTYQLSVFTRVANSTNRSALGSHGPWIWLVQVDKSGAEIQGGAHLPTGVQVGTNHYLNAFDWTQGTVTFRADPAAASFHVYAGVATAPAPITWWLDSVMLISLDHALSNVIRTSATDVIVRPAGAPRNGSAVYAEGSDYELVRAPDPLTAEVDFRDAANASRLRAGAAAALRRLPGGAIAAGQKLWVDYDFQPGAMGFHTYDLWRGLAGHFPWPPTDIHPPSADVRSQGAEKGARARAAAGSPHSDFGEGLQSADLVDPLYFDIAINATVALLDFFAEHGAPIAYLNLDYDELQTVARDSRALTSGLTNGQLVASSINRIAAAVKAAHPAVRLVFWDDMLNPWHLHGSLSDQDNLQAQHYGREDGTLDHAMPLVEDRTIIWLNWFYDWPYSNQRINQSLAMEWALGFDTIGCPNEDFNNIQCYGKSLSASEQGLGMMDTDWDGSYKGTVRTAEVAWGYRANATLECDVSCGAAGLPPCEGTRTP
jgi:hypothetical protein